MSEPASVAVTGGASVTGTLVVLLGPVLGPWVAVLLAAAIGALWAVGSADTESKLHALVLGVHIVLTALVLTGIAAALLISRIDVPADYALPAMAFGIAFFGDKFGVLKEEAIRRVKSLGGGSQ